MAAETRRNQVLDGTSPRPHRRRRGDIVKWDASAYAGNGKPRQVPAHAKASTEPRGYAERFDRERLIEEAAGYRTIFDNAIVGICFSIDRQIVRCNRRFEEMFGYRPGELDGRPFLEIYPAEQDYLKAGRSIYRHFLTHRVYADERLMKCKDGELFWCAVSGKRLGRDRRPRRAVWILQDVSSRKHAEEALQKTHQRLEHLVCSRTLKLRQKNQALQAEIARRKATEEQLRQSLTLRKQLEEQERVQRMELSRVSRLNTLGEMAAAMAHDLGQPLSSAVNFLSGCKLRLAAGECDPQAMHDTLSEAIYYVEQAGDIIKHIRQFVRRHEPERVACNLDSIIAETLRFMDIERRQHAAIIRVRLERPLAPVLVDPLEIKQVLVNLVKNGFEAMTAVSEPQRVLTISTRVKGCKWLEIAVADRGPGVSQDERDDIFKPFFSTKANGLGLGLAICRSIIESHGGTLMVGANPDGGAVFKVTVPRAAAD